MQIDTFLDVLLIEEIPVENATDTGIVNVDGKQLVRSERAAKKPMTGKVISCDARFPYNGVWVDMPYRKGDVVRTNEFGRNYIVLNPEDEFRPEAKKYYLIRYEDIEGRVVQVNASIGVGRLTKEVIKIAEENGLDLSVPHGTFR